MGHEARWNGRYRERYRCSRTSTARIYANANALLLAHTDSLHRTLSGLAAKKRIERAFELFRERRYARKFTAAADVTRLAQTDTLHKAIETIFLDCFR